MYSNLRVLSCHSCVYLDQVNTAETLYVEAANNPLSLAGPRAPLYLLGFCESVERCCAVGGAVERGVAPREQFALVGVKAVGKHPVMERAVCS